MRICEITEAVCHELLHTVCPPSILGWFAADQSAEQQDRDRYECYLWAVEQSGFDPTQLLGGVKESEAAAKRADYRRAMTVCLEARGYSVK